MCGSRGTNEASLFRALDIFLYDRSSIFCERIACAISRRCVPGEGRGKRGVRVENPPRGEEPDVTEGRCMGARGRLSARPHEPNREGEEKKRRVNLGR